MLFGLFFFQVFFFVFGRKAGRPIVLHISVTATWALSCL